MSDDIARKIIHGQPIMDLSQMNNDPEFIIENEASEFMALCSWVDGVLRIKRVV